MKPSFILIIPTLLLIALSLALAEENAGSPIPSPENQPTADNAKEIDFNVDPGILPDSPFYFLDQAFEFNADNPENAWDYKQEKIAEALAMAEKQNAADAKEALDKALEYSSTLEKEVTPEMEQEVARESTITKTALEELSSDVPELEEHATELIEKEDKIKAASHLSSKIKKLCETLAKLDAQKYAETCKTTDESPQWQQELDEELTDEQQQHAKSFIGKLKECAQSNGVNCDCQGMGIQSFEALCKRESALAAKCQAGDDASCQSQVTEEEIFNSIPSYLHPTLKSFMKGFESGAIDEERVDFDGSPESIQKFVEMCRKYEREESCAKKVEMMKSGKVLGADGTSSTDVIFQYDGTPESEQNFMEMCLKYEDKGSCGAKLAVMKSGQQEQGEEEVEFGPGPCADAGLKTIKECDNYMDAHYEKIGPGQWRGTSTDSVYVPQVSFGTDCNTIVDVAEKSKCYEDFYNSAKNSFTPEFKEENDINGEVKEVPTDYVPVEPTPWTGEKNKEYNNDYPPEYQSPSVPDPTSNVDEDYQNYLKEYQQNQEQYQKDLDQKNQEAYQKYLEDYQKSITEQPVPEDTVPIPTDNSPAPSDNSGESGNGGESGSTPSPESSPVEEETGNAGTDTSNQEVITGSAVREYDQTMSPVTRWILKFIGHTG
ncbi:hypothetical protein HYU22_04700 [Candidatus Woesearchaeota archaeon]|nr:hypothetical protein [Candidatus Woesearchaeota archaeon]